MKLTGLSLLVLSGSAIHARFVEKHETNQIVLGGPDDAAELYLIELTPDQTMWVTEEEKWELKRVSITWYESTSS